MARTFTSSTTDDARNTTASPGVVSAAAFTIGGWLYPTGSAFVTSSGSFYGSPLISDSGGYWGVYRTNLSGSDRVYAYNYDGAVKNVASTYSTNAWQHFAARLSGGTLEIFRDGASQATMASGNCQVITGSLRIGANYQANQAMTLNGRLAEIFAYPVALTDGEILALGKGYSPLLVRPAALQFYAPMYGSWSPELDLISGLNLTITGTAKSDHPPILRPDPGLWLPPPAAAPPALLSAADTAVLADLAALSAAALAASEILSLAEQAQVAAVVLAAESLSLSDLAGIQQDVAASDLLTLLDAASLPTPLLAADVLSFTEAASVVLALAASEGITLTDAATVAAALDIVEHVRLGTRLAEDTFLTSRRVT